MSQNKVKKCEHIYASGKSCNAAGTKIVKIRRQKQIVLCNQHAPQVMDIHEKKRNMSTYQNPHYDFKRSAYISTGLSTDDIQKIRKALNKTNIQYILTYGKGMLVLSATTHANLQQIILVAEGKLENLGKHGIFS